MNATTATLVAAAVAAQLSVFSTTMYLHRSATHGGVKFHSVVEVPMRVWLWLYTGIVAQEWVAIHRKHHQTEDTPDDPHSPKYLGTWYVTLFNYRLYINAGKTPGILMEFAPDLSPRSWFDRLLAKGWLGFSIGFVSTAAVGALCFGFWPGLVCGAAAFAAQMLYYVFGSGVINGLGHAVGYQNSKTSVTGKSILARNIAPLDPLFGGEILHNNHHFDPQSPWLSFRWFEFDPAGMAIRFLHAIGLARVKPRYLA